jgi:hypothetical protein
MPEVPKMYKVHMSEKAYFTLQIEAALKGESLKDAVSRLVIDGVSKKTIAAMKAAQSTHEDQVPKGTIEQSPQGNIDVPKGTIEQSPNEDQVPKGTIEQSLQEPKSPLFTSPPSSELLSSKEKVALEHLRAGKTYREIEALEKDKTGLTKAIVSGMAQKFKGMGLYQGGKRGPKAKS